MSQQSSSLTLTVQTGPQPGQTFVVKPGVNRIGRAQANDICLPEPSVSRNHARIVIQQGGTWIEDLGSSNGTFVNGRRITAPTRLQPGDTVQVGTSVKLGVQSVGALLPVQQPSYVQPAQPHSPPPAVVVPRSPSRALGGIIALSALLIVVGVGGATWFALQKLGSSPDKPPIDQAVPTGTPTVAQVIVTEEPTPEPVPEVDISFTAAKTTVKLGECVTLRWSVDNAQEVRLDGEVVPAEGSRKVCPRQASQTYRLTVLTLDGVNKEEAVSLIVPPTPSLPPEVEIDFTADQTTVNYGSCTTLRWSVTNVQAVRLDGEQVGSQGSREVCPEAPANTYLLLVDPLEGEIVERAIVINVPATPTPTPTPTSTSEPQSIYIHFTADQYTLWAQECTTLRWTVRHAHTVRLDGTAVASQSSQRVCPPSLTNNYRLTAIGSNGQSAEEMVTITVIPQTQLSLTADQSTLQQGSCTTLRWQAQDVQAAYLNGGGQFNNLPVSGSGSQQICPPNTTTYVLTANLIGGGSDSRSVTVSVSVPPPPPPSVPPRYDIGATVGYVDSSGRRCFTLQGFIEGVREAHLNGGQFNNEPLTGPSWTRLVCHDQATTYVLTVILPDGSSDSVSVTREGP